MSNEDIKVNDNVTIPAEKRTQCEVWTRVMGYHRPVQSYNVGKKGEFEERKYFTEDAAKHHKFETITG